MSRSAAVPDVPPHVPTSVARRTGSVAMSGGWYLGPGADADGLPIAVHIGARGRR